nr:hypothetical protein Itr_chr08CG14390 [Ipomoea trifida]
MCSGAGRARQWLPVDVNHEAERRQALPLLPAGVVNGKEESRRQRKAHVFSSLVPPSYCAATNLHPRRAWNSSSGDLQAAVDSGNHDGRHRRCAGFRSASGGQ